MSQEEIMLTSIENNNEYQLIEKIGEGAFGEVFVAVEKATEELVALKIVNLSAKRISEIFHREVRTAKLLQGNCDNILDFRKSYSFSYNNEEYGVIAMEKMDIDLMDYLLRANRLEENIAKYIFRAICKGVAHCHSLNIVHLDIKPDNVLLRFDDENPEEISQIKLCDFGYSSKKKSVKKGEEFGTYEYRPPECSYNSSLSQQVLLDKVDIWGLGVTLFVLITGLFPVVYKNNKVYKTDLATVNAYCKGEDCYHLVKWMLNENPADRPSVFDILNHPWLVGNTSSLINITSSIEDIESAPPASPHKRNGFLAKLKKKLK